MMNFASFNKYHYLIKDPAFWATIPLIVVLLPHFQRFPLWIPVIIFALVIWRISAINKLNRLPRKWVLFAIIILASIGTVFNYGTLFGKNAGTAILAVLLAVKSLESRKQRDYMLLIGLSFFLVVTNFLFSQGIPTVIFMLFIVLLLIVSMISINENHAAIHLKEKTKLASIYILQAFPLMLILFVLVPRIPGPIWKLPDDAKTGRTGLSESMSPGNISQLIQSNEVAFRVLFKDEIPPQEKLYWRALVLWYFDGRSWEIGEQNRNPRPTLEAFGKAVEYNITLEPHSKKWLFALDMPIAGPNDSVYNNNFLLRAQHNIESLYKYDVKSHLNYIIEHELSIWEKNAGLFFPEDANLKTIALGRKWKKQFSHPEDIIKHALTKFNKENYKYTLRPPLTLGFNPVDQFLFDTQQGFCEHYSSAFTLLMRAAGIPARVILGYQGGDLNPLNNYLSVRQSDAHAWSEVWLENKGWVRVDPTAAIAPERIEQNLDAAIGENEYRPLHMHLNTGIFRSIKLYWDAIDNGWKQWVIGYDSKLQNKLLSAILNKKITTGDMTILLIVCLAIATIIITFIIFSNSSEKTKDPVLIIYNRFCKKLSKKGITREAYEGPVDFSIRAGTYFPEQKNTINLITQIYINFRFKSKGNPDQLNKMKLLVKKMNLRRE